MSDNDYENDDFDPRMDPANHGIYENDSDRENTYNTSDTESSGSSDSSDNSDEDGGDPEDPEDPEEEFFLNDSGWILFNDRDISVQGLKYIIKRDGRIDKKLHSEDSDYVFIGHFDSNYKSLDLSYISDQRKSENETIEQLRMKIEQSQEKINAKKDKIKDLEAKFKALTEKEFEAPNTEIRGLKSKIAKYEKILSKERDKSKSSSSSSKSSKYRNQEVIDTAKRKIKSSEAKIEKMKKILKDRKAITDKISSLNDGIDGQKEVIKMLKEQIKSIEEESEDSNYGNYCLRNIYQLLSFNLPYLIQMERIPSTDGYIPGYSEMMNFFNPKIIKPYVSEMMRYDFTRDERIRKVILHACIKRKQYLDKQAKDFYNRILRDPGNGYGVNAESLKIIKKYIKKFVDLDITEVNDNEYRAQIVEIFREMEGRRERRNARLDGVILERFDNQVRRYLRHLNSSKENNGEKVLTVEDVLRILRLIYISIKEKVDLKEEKELDNYLEGKEAIHLDESISSGNDLSKRSIIDAISDRLVGKSLVELYQLLEKLEG